MPFNYAKELMSLIAFDKGISVCDIGAAEINNKPVYMNLVNKIELENIYLFDGDGRQLEKLNSKYGDSAVVLKYFLGSGEICKAYICEEMSGMTSLLKPSKKALKFFNGFEIFGKVLRTEQVQTTKLDDVVEVEQINFLKMDIQGSELSVLKNGKSKLHDCVAMQLEVSYFNLYENQPSFGEVDIWMRDFGFVPHRFMEVKRWSISPTIREKNFRSPFNQLLESDIIYIRDPLQVETYSTDNVKRMALFADLLFNSPDLTVYYLMELVKRDLFPDQIRTDYINLFSKKSR